MTADPPAQATLPVGEIYSVGHWTCPEEIFIGLLDAHDIDLLVDVRSHPGSRRSPHFGRDAMRGWLSRAGIDYLHLPELGGRRPRQDVDPDLNAGWQQPSFKNYADYTLLPDYQRGISRLTELASQRSVVYMCAEPMPWRCHRLLISNTLLVRGWIVWHLMAGSAARRHELGKWGAQPVIDRDGRVTYPSDASPLDGL